MLIRHLFENVIPYPSTDEERKLFRNVISADMDDLGLYYREIVRKGSDEVPLDLFHDPDFLDWAMRYLDERFSGVLWDIEQRFVGNLLPVYRVITAPSDWNPEGRHPGIYWSWDKRAAQAHCGEFRPGHIQWMMEAFVNPDQIDWQITWEMNLMSIGDDEKEIRLKEGVPVKVEKFYRHR